MDSLEKDLRTSRDGVAETKTRLEAANEKVYVLEADVAKRKKDAASLRT